MAKLSSITDDQVRVVIFDADKYPNHEADFTKAFEAGDVDILDVDEDSYTMFYNIQNSVLGAAELLGKKIHLGTCKNDIFVSINEMDGFASELNGGAYEAYSSRQGGFEDGLSYRKWLKEAKSKAS
jgi:hypothetical protein